ncbi:MAG TPA: hypothetical protein VJ482_13320 [Acidimicrobiia bacterium]|nr:hypothetical protein [Acidimicrobiia bacterium]
MPTRTMVMVIIGVLLSSACSAEVVPDQAGATAALPSSTSTGAPPIDRPEGAVLVVITGVIEPRADGVLKICPGQGDSCAGIVLTGTVAVPDPEPPVLRVTGWYDGSELLVIASETPDPSTFTDPDFSTPCEGLRGPASVNPPDESVGSIVAYTATIPDRFAGMWWDRASAVMTVRLTGDDIENHRRALEDAAGEDMAVCVSGGADYSETALIDIQRRVFDLIDREATAMWASSVGALTNRVEVMVEYLDGATRALVEGEFGDAVVFEAFVEVLEGTIADLPAQEPAHPGDVKLLTQSNRAGGGMQALGTFEVAFDQDLDCVFFPGDESSPDGRGRVVPVWPFGYTAESNPLRIYDQDGELVAEEGDVIQMGGGFVEHVTENELCGAGGAWIMSSHPEIVNP